LIFDEQSPYYRISRQILDRIIPGSMILMYHRVSNQVDLDPWRLIVTPEHFVEQMQVIREFYRPVALQSLNQQVQTRKHVPRSIAITFDDGYADNLHFAHPILEKLEIPATVFVVSGFVGREQEFWWDELEQILLLPGELPGSLSLDVDGHHFYWDLGESSNYTSEDFDLHHAWDANWQKPPTSRQKIYLELHSLLRPLLPAERERAFKRLWEWAGGASSVRPANRSLTPSELIQLVNGELVEAGAHTVTHPLLSALSVDLQRAEIGRSKTKLEEITGSPIETFSYPYGDYDSSSVEIVKELGFHCACSTIVDGIWFKVHPFLLPRLDVKDWDGEEFSRRLRRWAWT
jgi:peptidoglycan/xylan/chitin deacetylase (PgdA/CDA1 family)